MNRLAFLILSSGVNGSADVCRADGECAGISSGWASGSDGAASISDMSCRDAMEVLSAEIDMNLLSSRDKPAVITGLIEKAGWNVSLFDRATFEASFGSVGVKVFSPSQAALLGAHTSRVHHIGHVLNKLQDSGQLLYVFDSDFFSHHSAKGAAKLPKWLSAENQTQLLALGGPQSGTQFHAHGESLLTLFAGRKRWYLHRVGAFPHASARALHRKVSVWEKEVLPKLGDSAPLTCLQHPGDAIFVPSAWAHATVNLDETIGVALQSTVSSVNTCISGRDYMCLIQQFNTVATLNPASQASLYRDLFKEADEITNGFPVGFLRHIGPYWRISPEAETVFKKQRSRLTKFLKVVKPNSDTALLGAALTKSLMDSLHVANKDFQDIMSVVELAFQKAPESGLGIPFAQILGKQGRWREVVRTLEGHLTSFPHDTAAAKMIIQAREFAKKQQ